MSAAAAYISKLGAAVAAEFGTGVSFSAIHKRLVWPTSFGGSFVGFDGSNKWSPLISVDFYFGNRYESATTIERLVGRTKNQLRAGHILQSSLNAHSMHGLSFSSPCVFEIDIRSPPVDIVSAVVLAIRQIAVPFWDRYPSVRSARDALLSDKEWCTRAGGPFWHDLLYLDAALDELDHYESWLAGLESFYVPHASAEFGKVRDALNMQSNKSPERQRGE